MRSRLRDVPSKDEVDRLIATHAEERAREIVAANEEALSGATGRGEVEASFNTPGS